MTKQAPIHQQKDQKFGSNIQSLYLWRDDSGRLDDEPPKLSLIDSNSQGSNGGRDPERRRRDPKPIEGWNALLHRQPQSNLLQCRHRLSPEVNQFLGSFEISISRREKNSVKIHRN